MSEVVEQAMHSAMAAADSLDEWLGSNYASMDWKNFTAEWKLEHGEGGPEPELLPWRALPLSHPIAPLLGVVFYAAGLSLLKRFMRERGPYDFRKTMFVHNAFLCVLSAVMFAAVTWEAGKLLVNEGFAAVWNDPTWRLPRSPISLWCYVFYVSKYYELLDTVFILLKKREPDIVQLWHHTVVLLLFWSYMESRMMNHWWLVWANAFVHIFVYGYFAAATLKIDVWFKKYITILQISQFVFDMAYSLPFPVLKSYGNTRGDWEPWYFGQFIGATFIVLFTRIYFRISAAQARKAAAAKAAKQKGEGAESRGNGNAEQRATTPARQRGASPAPGLKRRAARSK